MSPSTPALFAFSLEAAMMGANIAPGMHREFQAQNWDNIVSPKLFARGFEEAESLVDTSVEMDIQGYDIDPQIVKAARENAKRAGVDGLIHFQQRPVHHLSHPKKYGFVITNPPYGERLEEKEDLPAVPFSFFSVVLGLETCRNMSSSFRYKSFGSSPLSFRCNALHLHKQ